MWLNDPFAGHAADDRAMTPPDEPDFSEEETDAAAAIMVDIDSILNLHVPCLSRCKDGDTIKEHLEAAKKCASDFYDAAERG